jgi:exosome complex component CSL4
MNEASTEKFVLPGDFLGTAEEFVPGFGTYEDNGRVYAALLGKAHVDPSARSVTVEAVHAIPRVHEGDLVYARVEEIKTAMAICEVLAAADTNRAVPGTPEGTIHISKAKEGYTETLAREFSSGDVVLARVLQSHPTIKLTTAAADLGVVSARCQVCHALLQSGPKDLVCLRCGNHEHRKLAKNYGGLKGVANPEDGPRD